MTDIRHSILRREIYRSRVMVAFDSTSCAAEALSVHASLVASSWNELANETDIPGTDIYDIENLFLYRSLAWAWAEKAIGERID